MKAKILVYVLPALILAAIHLAEAQTQVKVHKIGWLSPGSATSANIGLFLREIRKLGYVEGENIAIEYRFAEGKLERLPGLAAELVRLKVDVIVGAGGTPAILAAKNATSTIPIVFPAVSDPVALGIVASLARPGGNITGLTIRVPEFSGKRLEILKEVDSPG